jgi:uncharacterized protein (DUF983 family)
MKFEESKAQWTSVSLDAVTPIFVILIIGITLAMVMLFLERQTVGWALWLEKRHKSNRGMVAAKFRRM